MPSSIKASRKHRPSSRRNNMSNRPVPTTPISIISASAAGSVLTVEFNQVIKLNGTPEYIVDVAGAVPVSAVATSPTTIELTYDIAIAAATSITIPYEEPGVRNSSGGFVSHSTFPV